MNITLFGSENEVADVYKQATIELAGLIANGGHTIVWGATDGGLMKVAVDTMQAQGAKIIGIGADYIKHKMRASADEIVMAKDMDDRNSKMLEMGHAILALPGGVGTINEITYVLRLKKHGFSKPIAALNTDNFFGGLKAQLERMQSEGFLKNRLEDIICFADTPGEAMRYIESNGN
ncbi:MAG: LOG family protein [Patescibacteria group bacterium]|nr:LOG family protein [bacterium]MDZ4227097.1 LOG family protein [Patescibacteria group bacterium]